MVMKLRKKPITVEALQWSGNEDEMAEFLGELFVLVDVDDRLRIDTLEGTMWANLGDYVIKGIKGEFYPHAGDFIFEAYEDVTDDN